MSAMRQDPNRINEFAEPRSSVNGKENTAAKDIDVFKIKDWERRVVGNEFGQKADLQKSPLRRKARNAEADSVTSERPLHGQDASTSGFRGANRRRSEGQSLLKATLTPPFANTRRKSASELEGKAADDNSMKNSRSISPHMASPITWWTEQNQGNIHNNKSATLHRNEHSVYGNDSIEETLTFPAMHGVSVNARDEHRMSSPHSWPHRNESKGNRLNNEDSVTVSSKRLVHFDKDFPTHKISLPDPGRGNLSWKKVSDQELTRARSFSDSEVEDSLQMTTEEREKLEHLKHQILEKNLKRKDGRKVSAVKQNTVHRESRFPVLTEKSLKRYSKCHENGAGSLSAFNADQKISLIDVSLKVNPAGSEFAAQNQDFDIETGYKITRNNCDATSNAEQTSEFNTAPPSSTLACFENTQEVLLKRKSNGVDNPTPPNSEAGEGDFESISVIFGRLRARSEPGDVGTRKVSTVQQLQNRARSETDELKTKVHSFVKKPLPALPPSTLRVTKQAVDAVSSKGHFKAGANTNITFEKPIERKEGVINIHTCPNMNLFSDKSWMYQDESRKRHRYIRGPATPVPPVEFVFRENEPDSP